MGWSLQEGRLESFSSVAGAMGQPQLLKNPVRFISTVREKISGVKVHLSVVVFGKVAHRVVGSKHLLKGNPSQTYPGATCTEKSVEGNVIKYSVVSISFIVSVVLSHSQAWPAGKVWRICLSHVHNTAGGSLHRHIHNTNKSSALFQQVVEQLDAAEAGSHVKTLLRRSCDLFKSCLKHPNTRPACLVSALDIASAFCLRPRVSPIPSWLHTCSSLWLHSSPLDLSAS